MSLWSCLWRAAHRRPRNHVPAYGAEAHRFRVLQDLAAELAETEQGWHVYASASTGALVAMPMWDPGTRLILTAPTPAGLRAQMRQAEAEAVAHQIIPEHRGGAGPPPWARRRGPLRPPPESPRTLNGQYRMS
jgi:hypothetical protein